MASLPAQRRPPKLPRGLVPHVDERGDEVYDHGRLRWRYRGGKLLYCIEYYKNTAVAREPSEISTPAHPWRKLWRGEA